MADLQTLFNQFHEIAETPAVQFKKFLDAGEKVVGCAPGYTPEEVIHAMGFVPFGVWGAYMQVEDAKAYFPAFIPSLLQTMLELGIKGKYDGMTAIVIPSLSDSLKALGENWKYAVKNVPFITAVYPQNRAIPCGREFTKAAYKRIEKRLNELTGAVLTDEKLAASIEIYNAHNAAMRDFAAACAKYDCLTPCRRRDVFKSAWFMRKEDHTKLVRALLDELVNQPVEHKKLRIITSGIIVDNNNLLQILEDNNINIVADDVLHESRQYRVDATEGSTAIEKLVDKFARMDYCSLLYDKDKKRGPMLVDLAQKTKAGGVIVFLTKFSDPEEFDYVPLRRALQAAGIPVLLIEIDSQMDRFDQAQTAIETFVDLLS